MRTGKKDQRSPVPLPVELVVVLLQVLAKILPRGSLARGLEELAEEVFLSYC